MRNSEDVGLADEIGQRDADAKSTDKSLDHYQFCVAAAVKVSHKAEQDAGNDAVQ